MNLINEEVATGRMDRPFTIEKAQFIYGDISRCAPLGWLTNPVLRTLE